MKYKDFKTMSNDEMKGVKGGEVPVTGCTAICETTWSQGSNYFYAVSGLGSCEPQGNLCQPFDKFISLPPLAAANSALPRLVLRPADKV